MNSTSNQPGTSTSCVKIQAQDKNKLKTAATTRLQKDLMDLMMSSDKSVSAFPNGEDIFNWIATICGPKDTVYENLKFRLSMEFSHSYPYVSPDVKFISPCYHPNVDVNGNICLDILTENWSALYDVRTILLSLQSLLAEPDTMSPLNYDAAVLWYKPTEFRKRVLEVYKEV